MGCVAQTSEGAAASFLGTRVCCSAGCGEWELGPPGQGRPQFSPCQVGSAPLFTAGEPEVGLGSRFGEEGRRGRATAPLQAAWALLTPGRATAPLPHPCGPLSHARGGRRPPTSGPCQRPAVSCLKPSVSQGPQLSLCTRSCQDHSGPPPLSPALGLASRCWGYIHGESQEELAPRTPAEGAPRGPQWWLALLAGTQLWAAGPSGARGVGGAGGQQEGLCLRSPGAGYPQLVAVLVPVAAIGVTHPRVGQGTLSASLPTALSLRDPRRPLGVSDPHADPSRAPASPLRGAPGACPFSLQSARQLPATSAPSPQPSWTSFPNAGPTPPVLPWAHLTRAPRDKGTAPQTPHSHPRPGHSALPPTPSLLFPQPPRSDSQTPAHPPDPSSRSPAECP